MDLPSLVAASPDTSHFYTHKAAASSVSRILESPPCAVLLWDHNKRRLFPSFRQGHLAGAGELSMGPRGSRGPDSFITKG